LAFHVAVCWFVVESHAIFKRGGTLVNTLLDSVALAYLIGAGISFGTGLAIWRGERETTKRFVRWFPLYLMAEVLGVVVVMAVAWDQVKLMPTPIGLLILGVVFYSRFYQRQLARMLLRD